MMTVKIDSQSDVRTSSPAGIRDLRDFLAVVERIGQLKHVRGAHWNLELGGIAEVNNRQRGPCLVFDDIVDYPKGHRIATAALGTPARLAACLRLSTDLDNAGLVQSLRGLPQQWATQAPAFPPEYVPSGPVLENIRSGSEINLLDLPAPQWHEQDGGRYLGTGDVVITRDLESDWINLGTYRMMILSERSCGVVMAPGHHGRDQLEKYFKLGKPFPVAASLGHDPLLFLFSGLEVPYGVSEYNYAGAVAGERVKVVKGEVTGLPIPAASEIVIEGWCRPGNFQSEGPFGEFHGYYSAGDAPAPVLEVERIYHRNNPIILGSPPSRPPHDYSYSKCVMRSALLHDAIERAGVPGVVSCWADDIGGSRLMLVVSLRQQYQGHARQAGLIASQCHVGLWMGRYVIVVDEDIDPSNLTDVMWAVATRSDPARDIQILERTYGTKVDPVMHTLGGKMPYASRAIIDACRCFEHREAFPPVAEISPEFERDIRKKWHELLGGGAK